jgi:hypothetical protein
MRIVDHSDEVYKMIESQFVDGVNQESNIAKTLITEYTPVDTGLLASSVRSDKIPMGVGVGTFVPYGVYVEYGTDKQRPVRMFANGLLDATPEILENVAKKIKI